MSFLGFKEVVEEEDVAIIYLGHNNLLPLKLCCGKTTQTKYGALKHHDLIGKKYGTMINTHGDKGWLFILHPNPELWTVTLPHRTQILYFADISLITFELELKPGSLVAEAGTGSGSLSHAMARTLAPNGHLYTYEFHKQRADIAKEEFESHGLSSVVTLANRDVMKDGFQDDVVVDAVFLDLPSPWLVVPHAKKVLKTDGGRICSFSPCIEQAQRTCQILFDIGFCEVKTVECLLRPYDIRFTSLPEPNFGFPLQKAKADTEDGSVHGNDGNKKIEKSDLGSHEEVPPLRKKPRWNTDSVSGNSKQDKDQVPGGKYAVPSKDIIGHSGYLTFATLNESKM
ncbi:tRNA (adenine(58)-N(1))-methyltransferase catalytic subunit TRMT61A-like [Apostichopus japonicus]|uniref:tRNA (adenine(58)-N(1))-methyltransferase catalytic subunit TRMT61A-like n=1 Tax=Stichopus japonicus TaxID=307972 RepID=UPI003AB205BD